MDIRQSELWAKYLESFGWKSEKISSGCFAYIRKLPFLGTIMKIPRCPLPLPLKQINRLAQKNNTIFAKIEPEIETNNSHREKILSLLKTSGFSKDSWSLNPTRTIHIDLTKSEEELLKNMEKDTRYSIRLAARKGVEVKETNDFEQFKSLYYETAKRKKFWAAKSELEFLWKTFYKGDSAGVYTAFFEGEPLASALILFSDKMALYAHAGSLPKHREVMAPYLLLWQSIRVAKKKGCKIFDMEGIKDPRFRSTKKWGGFTLFKRGFRGTEVEYLGPFTKYYKLWVKVLFFFSRF